MKPAPASAPSLRYVRRIRATADEVFQAFVDPRVILHWWGPDEGPTLSAETDVRVGGRFRVAFRTVDGEHHETNGEYLELEPPRRLVMSWWWSTTPHLRTRVTVAIDPVDDGAQVTLVHEGFADVETRDSHEAGWAVAIAKMAARLEKTDKEERT
jgi:uncharacterized protein YndB with AHSA1/START domain